MIWQLSSLELRTLTFTLIIQFFTITPLLTQAQTDVNQSPKLGNTWEIDNTGGYTPPDDIGSPTRTESGSTRNPIMCSVDSEKNPNPPLTALVPKNMDTGVTVVERPTFFVYIPETTAKTVTFVLQDLDYKEIARTNFLMPKTPGIVSFKLPNNIPGLEVGKTYRWALAVICPPKSNGVSEEPGVYTKIWRTELRAPVANQLEKLPIRDRAKLYRQSKVWHEAISTLAELRQANPDNSQLVTEWKELLSSAGLSEFAEIPLVGD